MEHEVFLAFEQINAKLDVLLASQSNLTHLENLTVAKIDDLEQEVSKVSGVQDSAIALINGISQQLKDAAADPQRIQAVIDSLDAKSDALAAAVAANTPAPTPPAP